MSRSARCKFPSAISIPATSLPIHHRAGRDGEIDDKPQDIGDENQLIFMRDAVEDERDVEHRE